MLQPCCCGLLVSEMLGRVQLALPWYFLPWSCPGAALLALDCAAVGLTPLG